MPAGNCWFALRRYHNQQPLGSISSAPLPRPKALTRTNPRSAETKQESQKYASEVAFESDFPPKKKVGYSKRQPLLKRLKVPSPIEQKG